MKVAESYFCFILLVTFIHIADVHPNQPNKLHLCQQITFVSKPFNSASCVFFSVCISLYFQCVKLTLLNLYINVIANKIMLLLILLVLIYEYKYNSMWSFQCSVSLVLNLNFTTFMSEKAASQR